MMITLAKKVGNFALSIAIALFLNDVIAEITNAQEDEPQATQQKVNIIEVDRQRLCEKFPQNSNCKKEPPQVLKIRLDNEGSDREWIRIDKNRNTVKLVYTEEVENFIVSGLFGAALGAIPAPIPFSEELTPRQWSDRPTTRIAFKPDSCSKNVSNKSSQLDSSSCTVTGGDALILPEATDIRAGLFTLEYTEGELLRTVTFRIPSEVETEIVKTVKFATPSRKPLP
jgi:hypothetical protein